MSDSSSPPILPTGPLVDFVTQVKQLDLSDEFELDCEDRVRAIDDETERYLAALGLHTPPMREIAQAWLKPLNRHAIARVIVEQDNKLQSSGNLHTHLPTTGYQFDKSYSQDAKTREQVTKDVMMVLTYFSDKTLQGMVEGDVQEIINNRGPKVVAGSRKDERRPWIYIYVLTTSDGRNITLRQLDRLIELVEMYCDGVRPDGYVGDDQQCKRHLYPTPANLSLIKRIDNYGQRPGTASGFVSWNRARFISHHATVADSQGLVHRLRDLRARAALVNNDPDARLLIPGVIHAGSTFDHFGQSYGHSQNGSARSVALVNLLDAICRGVIQTDGLGMHYHNVAMVHRPEYFKLTEHVVSVLVRSYAWEDGVAGLDMLPAGHNEGAVKLGEWDSIYADGNRDITADGIVGHVCRQMVQEMDRQEATIDEARSSMWLIEDTKAIEAETKTLEAEYAKLKKQKAAKDAELERVLREQERKTTALMEDTMKQEELLRIQQKGWAAFRGVMAAWKKHNEPVQNTLSDEIEDDESAQATTDLNSAQACSKAKSEEV